MKFILSLLAGLMLVSGIAAQSFNQTKEKNYIRLNAERIGKQILPAAYDKSAKSVDSKEIDSKNADSGETANVPLPQVKPYVRPTKQQRVNRYLSDAFGVPAVIGSAFSAGISQIGNNPPEWNRTIGGYGKRFANSYGTNALRNTISFGLNEAFGLDNRFEKSGQKSVGKRIKHVFISSYTTRKKNGDRLPDFPYLIGNYSANIIASEAWMPDRFSYKDGLRNGTYSVFTRFGVNLLREFFFK
jgi:hypothetical protein